MSRYTRFVILLLITNLLLLAFISCAPPPSSPETTEKIQQGYALTIGTPNTYYRTEVLEISDRVQIVKFVDPVNKVTCYVGISSVSCVK